ncbi:MAG: periplasmic heavy metal sensor, partial [Planctomycetes bacterium]|nr:periplasmic heavy metal sensor [Planctomycetota bacterium]
MSSRRWWKRTRRCSNEKALSYLLLVSLVFNAAFVAGYFLFRTAPETLATTEKVTEAVADDLGLNKEQREKFAALHKKNEAESAKLREAIRITRESLMTEMSKPSPNGERIRTLQDELSELYRAQREASLKRYKTFMDTLNPGQRRQVAERVERHHRRHGGRRFPLPWVSKRSLQRFDADGDGNLSEEERAKAREAVLKEFGRRRPWAGREFGPPTAFPEMSPLFRTMRG